MGGRGILYLPCELMYAEEGRWRISVSVLRSLVMQHEQQFEELGKMVRKTEGGHFKFLWPYYGHHKRLLLLVQDGDGQRVLVVAPGQSCMEVHYVCVVVVITNAVVLPPAGAVSTLRGCNDGRGDNVYFLTIQYMQTQMECYIF